MSKAAFRLLFGFMHAERLGFAVAGPAALGYLLMGLLFLAMVPLRQPARLRPRSPSPFEGPLAHRRRTW
jgi:hypothetical protein